MTNFEKAISVMKDLFSRDYQFALSTAKNDITSHDLLIHILMERAFILLPTSYLKRQPKLQAIQMFHYVVAKCTPSADRHITLAIRL